MNKQMDLRSSDYISSRRFFKPRRLKFLAAGLIVLIMISLPVGIERYGKRLQQEISARETALQELSLLAGPLEGIVEEISLLETKSALLRDLKTDHYAKSNILLRIRLEARRRGLIIEKVSIGEDGALIIRATGPVVEQIALYNQALDEHFPVIEYAVSRIGINDLNGYSFEITGTVPSIEIEREEGVISNDW